MLAYLIHEALTNVYCVDTSLLILTLGLHALVPYPYGSYQCVLNGHIPAQSYARAYMALVPYPHVYSKQQLCVWSHLYSYLFIHGHLCVYTIQQPTHTWRAHVCSTYSYTRAYLFAPMLLRSSVSHNGYAIWVLTHRGHGCPRNPLHHGYAMRHLCAST